MENSGSIPLLFLTIPCFIQGIILLILNQVFESLVRQGLAIQAYYTMPPVLAIALSCVFNPRPIFKYVVDIDKDHKKAI